MPDDQTRCPGCTGLTHCYCKANRTGAYAEPAKGEGVLAITQRSESACPHCGGDDPRAARCIEHDRIPLDGMEASVEQDNLDGVPDLVFDTPEDPVPLNDLPSNATSPTHLAWQDGRQYGEHAERARIVAIIEAERDRMHAEAHRQSGGVSDASARRWDQCCVILDLVREGEHPSQADDAPQA